MKNLTIKHEIYAETSTRTGYRTMSAQLDGQNVLASIASPQVVEFIESSIKEVINRAVVAGEQAIDISVSLPVNINLSPEIKAHIVAKFEADPIVNSLVFS